VGDLDYEAEDRLRRGRRVFVVLSALLLIGLVSAGAWVNSQTPAAVALEPAAAQPSLPASAWNEHAVAVTARLALASGRSIQALADELPDPVAANPLESEAPTVAGAEAAGGEYAETLAALDEAEAAAAEQLSQTKKDLARAEKARKQASEDLAREEEAAARQIDAAIDAAIAAAQATAAFTVPLGGVFGGGSIPQGGPTSSAQVLQFVRKYFPADEVGNAMAISRCESGHANRVSAPNSNGSRDFGVFQLNDGGTLQAALRTIGVRTSGITQARKKALETELNVRMARAIWGSRGWQPWTCAAKLKIVAGLYQSAPGPMAGKYDDYGRAT
jgi:hypothetical protein